MTIALKTHRIHFPSAKSEPLPETAAGSPRQRPKITPGSFKVLVYGTD
jgi:hypothetical protein